MSPSRAFALYAQGGLFDDQQVFNMNNRKMVDQGGECSRELILVLRHKAARLQVRDPGQAGSAEPVPES
eukprot:13919689-Alexandrium_andersonii.AAC.1